MAVTDIDWGTITLTNGETEVVGVGTSFLADEIRDGDTFVFVDGADGFQSPIVESVQSNTELTLRQPWAGPTLTAATYTLRYQWDSSRVSAMSRRLIMLLDNGNLTAFSQLTGPGVAVFTGPHSMEVRPFSDFVNGARFDVQVDELDDRDAYDGQTQGFAVLVSDVGDGRSAIYSKNSNTSADWSDAAYVTGPIGASGPYTDITVGPVTTLPSGEDASVDVVQVDPTTIRLDFSIPKGEDGEGTGDMVGPSSSTANGFVGFSDTGGKQTKQLTSDQATAGLDVFEEDTQGVVPGPSSSDIAANRLLQADGTWVDPVAPIADGVVRVDIAQTFDAAELNQVSKNIKAQRLLLVSDEVTTSTTSIDIPLPDNDFGDGYKIEGRIKPATNNVALRVQFSSDGTTFHNTLYAYGYDIAVAASITGSNQASGEVAHNISNQYNSTFNFELLSAKDALSLPIMSFDVVKIAGDHLAIQRMFGGLNRSAIGPVKALRLFFSSGNISSAKFKVYAYDL